MKIAFVPYDQFTALDLVEPYEVLARWPDAEVLFVATGPDASMKAGRYWMAGAWLMPGPRR
jgi:putative intracellular protease/amidase